MHSRSVIDIFEEQRSNPGCHNLATTVSSLPLLIHSTSCLHLSSASPTAVRHPKVRVAEHHHQPGAADKLARLSACQVLVRQMEGCAQRL